uniref:Uncharacterized protein n=1 Tax=Arundo donax TaxID=35708 RepID=A0A0A9F634_ARUDO
MHGALVVVALVQLQLSVVHVRAFEIYQILLLLLAGCC